MTKFIVKIERVDNGFIVDSGEYSFVIQEKDEHQGKMGKNLECLRELCYMVLEEFGYFGSKHDPERLVVEIRDQRGVLDEG